jgi:hypothetical protein
MLSPAEIGGIAGGGGAVLIAGISWPLLVARSRRRRLDEALGGPDPATRLAALDLVAERGVSAHLVGVLVERALVENDPGVQAALVRALTHTRWEPGADRQALQLRAWATRTAEAGRELVALTESPAADGAGGSRPEPPVADPVIDDGREQVPAELELPAWLEPVMAKDFDGRRNGVEANGEEPGSSRARPIAKAEQDAVRVLREAGYGVATRSPSVVDVDRADDAAPVPTRNEVEFLRELGAQRFVTLTLMEEATRRMRAENARLERELARYREV